MASILIADDHAVVRRGLREMIEDSTHHTVIGEAACADDVFLLLRQSGKIDLIILDLNMPAKSGLDILLELRRLGFSTPVLILSMHPEEQFATRLFKAGASGYITKESAPEELLSAIEVVLTGRKYVSPSFGRHLLQSLDTETAKKSHETLSDREFQVLCLIASGKTVSEIGAHLSLSVKTVSTYRARILEKMGMETSAQLTHYVIHHGLLG